MTQFEKINVKKGENQTTHFYLCVRLFCDSISRIAFPISKMGMKKVESENWGKERKNVLKFTV